MPEANVKMIVIDPENLHKIAEHIQMEMLTSLRTGREIVAVTPIVKDGTTTAFLVCGQEPLYPPNE